MEIQEESRYRALTKAAGNNVELLAKGLAWFSIGLGLLEVAAPGSISKMIGIGNGKERHPVLRFYGAREIAAGIGILSQPDQPGWLWGRVAGDLLDLASLGTAANNGETSKVAMAASAVLGVTALDLYCAWKTSQEVQFYGPVCVRRSIIINKYPEEVYSFWREFEKLPSFMDRVESVQATDGNHWHWKVKGPAGMMVEWDSEVIRDQPNSMISWRSSSESDIFNRGSVHFERATGGRGTLVRVEMEYSFPGGSFGANLARMLGEEPGQHVESALRKIKQVLETGDVVRSDSSIHHGKTMHAAQPA